MKISSRVQNLNESITLKLNARAVELAEEGRNIYNLTAGQLPFRPAKKFVQYLQFELDFLKSFQYGPAGGLEPLREKVIQYISKTRDINLEAAGCLVSNGGKSVINNFLATMIDPGDEVVLLAPYWVSYPEMVELYGGKCKVVGSSIYDSFTPSLEKLEEALSDKTKVLFVNSPNNPSGIHYDEQWMEGLANLLLKYPDVFIVSDEIYFELIYFDPKPKYFYQFEPALLERTLICDGVSKSMAATGLRIGYGVGPKDLIKAMEKLQGQTASGPNSLVQRALLHFKEEAFDQFLGPIKLHLRDNAKLLKEKLNDANLGAAWYQPRSAFYFLIDFKRLPFYHTYSERGVNEDYSLEICERILNETGVAMVPGGSFGQINTGRISLVLEKKPFEEAIDILITFFTA